MANSAGLRTQALHIPKEPLVIDKLLGEPLGPWNILLGKSVFIYPRPWARPYHVCCNAIYGKHLFLYVHLGFWVILYHFDLWGGWRLSS